MISCNLCRFFWLDAIEIFIAVGLETSGASDKSSCPFYERGQFGKIAFAWVLFGEFMVGAPGL